MFEEIGIKGFCIALGNTWGLFLIILFLGYGIVAVPKKYWGMKNINRRLTYAYFRVGQKEDQL